MIVFKKLEDYLNNNNMSWKDLRNAGLSQNMPTRFAKNENVSTDTINRVCEYLQVQPGDIMSWVPDSEYEEKEKQKADIEKQIAQLKAQLKKL